MQKWNGNFRKELLRVAAVPCKLLDTDPVHGRGVCSSFSRAAHKTCRRRSGRRLWDRTRSGGAGLRLLTAPGVRRLRPPQPRDPRFKASEARAGTPGHSPAPSFIPSNSWSSIKFKLKNRSMTSYKYYEKGSFAFLSTLEKNCQLPY